MNKNEIISILKDLGRRPNKGLGQNFLIDKNILNKVVDSAEIKKGDRVLEIGPGLGVLTDALINSGATITTIEKDKVLADRLLQKRPPRVPRATQRVEWGQRGTIAQSAIRGICADAAKQDIDDLMGQKPWKFVSNLPYSITSLALRKALYAKNPPTLLIALIQKEVAERILAEDKKEKMSLLALMSHLACSEIKIIHRVSPSSFYPEPKVDSAIIKMVPLSANDRIKKWGIDPEAVMKVARLGFAHPRKLLGRNLGIKTEAWDEITTKLPINPKARAEELTAKEWVELAKCLNHDHSTV
jgi:16S rRNA (adenine1518-N6/adenine1519-N6)-dimethyltransferase